MISGNGRLENGSRWDDIPRLGQCDAHKNTENETISSPCKSIGSMERTIIYHFWGFKIRVCFNGKKKWDGIQVYIH